MFYFAKRSNPVGITPAHLRPYAEKFKVQAPKCAAEIRGMPKGKEKVLAMRDCMARNLG